MNGYGCDSGYDDGGGHAFGQSWSQLRVARVGNSASNRTLLIFGGGYDPTVEDADPALTSGRTMGHGLFVVDPYTGNVIARIRPTNMDFTVPSDIALIDLDGNGFVDRLYFGDTGGQVWRVEYQQQHGSRELVEPAHCVARPRDGKRFQQRVAVAGNEQDRILPRCPEPFRRRPAESGTCGRSENPLNGATDRGSTPVVANRLYSLRDNAARGSTVITESRLEDRTNNNYTINDNLGCKPAWIDTVVLPPRAR